MNTPRNRRETRAFHFRAGAECGALPGDSRPGPTPATPPAKAPDDPDLRLVIERWPDLPPAIRAEVLALVNAARRE
ncbi:MAG: hypothetical protein FJ255_08240 [Phycisphaerae bacterium]|nr:hypothetical protein [Phycisphaerae bacterium]